LTRSVVPRRGVDVRCSVVVHLVKDAEIFHLMVHKYWFVVLDV
jgi:hypothetical protein